MLSSNCGAWWSCRMAISAVVQVPTKWAACCACATSGTAINIKASTACRSLQAN